MYFKEGISTTDCIKAFKLKMFEIVKRGIINVIDLVISQKDIIKNVNF